MCVSERSHRDYASVCECADSTMNSRSRDTEGTSNIGCCPAPIDLQQGDDSFIQFIQLVFASEPIAHSRPLIQAFYPPNVPRVSNLAK
jgi:hypothetical protein